MIDDDENERATYRGVSRAELITALKATLRFAELRKAEEEKQKREAEQCRH